MRMSCDELWKNRWSRIVFDFYAASLAQTKHFRTFADIVVRFFKILAASIEIWRNIGLS